jgi:hypothetical protein
VDNEVLTKRERLAGMAMQGLLMNQSFTWYARTPAGGEHTAMPNMSVAVLAADKLLAAIAAHPES